MQHSQDNELIFEAYRGRPKRQKRNPHILSKEEKKEIDRKGEEAKEWLRKNTIGAPDRVSEPKPTNVNVSTSNKAQLKVGDVVTLKRDVNSILPDDHKIHPYDQMTHEMRNTGKIVEVKYRVKPNSVYGVAGWFTAEQLNGPFQDNIQAKDFVPDHPDMEHL